MELDFNKCFKIIFLCMSIAACNPYVKRNKKWMVHFAIVKILHTILGGFILYEFIFVALRGYDINAAILSFVKTSIYIIIVCQYITLNLYRSSLLVLMENVKKDYESSKSMPKEEQDIIEEYAGKCSRLCSLWLAVPVSGVISFYMRTFILMGLSLNSGQFKIPEFLDSTYPEFIESNKENTFVAWALYIMYAYYSTYTGFIYEAFTPVGPFFMIHACGQLELARKRIDDLQKVHDMEEMASKLKEIILLLHYIYSCTDIIKEFYGVVFDFVLKNTAVMVPTTLYVIINGDESNWEYMIFALGGIIYIAVPCYYGDFLIEKGEEVRQALYACGWEKFNDRRIRTTIMIMMMRANKPIVICTVFCTLCLETFADVMQQSYSLFNLLNAMWS